MTELATIRRQHDYGAEPLEIVCFASVEVDLEDIELESAVSSADLVVALGNVDLDRLAALLAPDKPALCVRGPQDPDRLPPAPFRVLHGNGVVFNGWRIAGLSGGSAQAAIPTPGTISDQEAASSLGALPDCDLLLSHAPPAGQATPHGLKALTRYLTDKPPIYHFYAAESDHQVFHMGETLIVGVHGALIPPALIYA